MLHLNHNLQQEIGCIDVHVSWMWVVLETTWKQARNESFKVHEMEQLYLLKEDYKACMLQMLQS